MNFSTKQVRETLKNTLPTPLLNPAKALYSRLKRVHLAQPAVTIYFNRPDLKTYIGMNNFYSWVAPHEAKNAMLKAVFYSAEGKKIFEHKESLAYFGTANLDVKELFQRAGIISDFGIFAIHIEPNSRWNPEYKKLGLLTGIYFTLYRFESGAVSIVHPNARLGKESAAPQREWRSYQVIQTKNLIRLRFYQMTPLEFAYPNTYSLVNNETGQVLISKSAACKPLSSEVISFEIQSLENIPAEVRLVVGAWPLNNSKPLVERVFANGLSTISHT